MVFRSDEYPWNIESDDAIRIEYVWIDGTIQSIRISIRILIHHINIIIMGTKISRE